MTESSKDVANVDEKSNAVAAYDYGADAGGGFENTTQDDFKMPFLRLLQGLSPQVETVDGAKAGMWCNVVTNALFPDGIEFVPAITEHYYVEYERAEDGSRLPGGEGFRGIHKATDKMVLDAIAEVGDNKFVRDESTGKIVLPKSPDGFDLVETKYAHGVQHIRDTGAILPAVIAFGSTHLPAMQSWLTTARNEVIPGTSKSKPLFAHLYKLGSMKKTKGANTWYIPTISFVGGSAKTALLDPASNLYQAAKVVRDMVAKGHANVDHAQGAQGDSGGGGKRDENIPF